MSEKKYNHYVPKFLLGNFSGNPKCIDKCIVSTRQIIRNASTKSTGGYDFLYGKDSSIEDAFSELEGIWASFLSKVISSKELPRNIEAQYTLISFIVLSDLRTLAVAKDITETITKQAQGIATLYKEHGRLDCSDELISSLKVELDCPNSYALHDAPEICSICSDLKADLIENRSSIPFILSDRPVIKYNQFLRDNNCPYPYGYGQVGIQLFLPISPDLCLILYDPSPYRKYLYRDGRFLITKPEDALAINRLSIVYTDEEVFLGKKSSERSIQKLLTHYADEKEASGAVCIPAEDGFYLHDPTPSYFKNIHLPLLRTRKEYLDYRGLILRSQV